MKLKNESILNKDGFCPHCGKELIWKVVGDFLKTEVGHWICYCGYSEPHRAIEREEWKKV